MDDILPRIYLISFCVGPVYFLFNFLLAQVAGNDLGESDGHLDELEASSTDFISGDSLSDNIGGEIDEVDFDSVDTSDIDNSNDLKLNYFSPKIWVAIITGFGFGGYFSIEVLNKGGIASLVSAGMIGLLIGTFLFSIISYLYAHTSKNDSPLKVVGRKGIVTLSIPYKKVGLVILEYKSGNQEFRAISQHGQKLEKGKIVKVVKYISERQLVIVKETN